MISYRKLTNLKPGVKIMWLKNKVKNSQLSYVFHSVLGLTETNLDRSLLRTGSSGNPSI